jgi:hypothetical protein
MAFHHELPNAWWKSQTAAFKTEASREILCPKEGLQDDRVKKFRMR